MGQTGLLPTDQHRTVPQSPAAGASRLPVALCLGGSGAGSLARQRLSQREDTLLAEKLPKEVIEAWAAAHPRWRFRDGAILKEYSFGSFRSAIVFVNRVATIADELNHHPDISVRYDRVLLRMWSHDAGGVTERDLNLAERIDFATSAR